MVTGVNDASLRCANCAFRRADPLPHSLRNMRAREFSSSIKKTVWIGLCCFSAPSHPPRAVIIFVFYDHRHAVATQLRFFPVRAGASVDICTVTLKPMQALMIPIDSPRLPVEPTAILYWLKNCLNSAKATRYVIVGGYRDPPPAPVSAR